MMKTIKKIMTGTGIACILAAMYYCFLKGAPSQGTGRILYMVLAGIFCISVWTAVMGSIWYVKWLQKNNSELKNMIETLLKNTDKLDK